jgi:hypothetical protein
MGSTTIRPAQLMMEFMAAEQGRIGQGISSQEFSAQLEEQRVELRPPRDPSSAGFTRPHRQAAVPGSPRGKSLKDYMASRNGSYNGRRLDNQPAGVLATASPTAEAKTLRQWETAQQVQVGDSMTLDKVLGELHVAPDLRESLKGNSFLNGAVSLQQLSGTLDQALQTQEVIATEGKTEASEVRTLLGSLQLPQNSPVPGGDQFQLKSAGVYNLVEFRQLLQRVVEQSAQPPARQNEDRGVVKVGGKALAVLPDTPVSSGNATGKLTRQPDTAGILLAGPLLDDRLSRVGTSIPGSLLAGTGRGANAARALADVGLGAGSGEDASVYGQSLDFPGIVGATPRGISSQIGSGSALESPVSALRGLGMSGSGNPVGNSGAPSAGVRDVASATPAAPLQVAMEFLGSLGGSAEAVIRGFHFEPGAQRSVAAQNDSADAMLNKSLAAPIVESVAAVEQAASGEQQATSDKRQAAGDKLQAASSKLQASGSLGQGAGWELELATESEALPHKVATSVNVELELPVDGLENLASSQRKGEPSADHQEAQQNPYVLGEKGASVPVSGGATQPGHAAGVPPSNSNSWIQVVADRALEMQQQRQHQLTLEVESKDLGRVLLRVETENHQVRAVITAESDQIRDLLHRSAPQLRQQLESLGLVLGHLSIDVRDRRGERHHFQQRNGQGLRETVSQGVTAAMPSQWVAGGAASVPGTPEHIINVFA